MKKIASFFVLFALALGSAPLWALRSEADDATQPDLEVTNLQFIEKVRDPGHYSVRVDYANRGAISVDVDTGNGYNRAILNEGTAEEFTTSYTWSAIHPDYVDFLNAGGETLEAEVFSRILELEEGDLIEVCIDVANVVVESDEDNNCITDVFHADEVDEEPEAPEGLEFLVEAGPDRSLTLGETLNLGSQATIRGLSGSDYPRVTLNWGDGTVETPELVIDNPIVVIGSHEYEQSSGSDPYQVRICAEDSDEGELLQTRCDSFTVTVEASSGGGSSGGGSGGGSSSRPDLEVTDIDLQSDGDIVATLENSGEKDVSSSDEVKVELRIDGDLEWDEDYEQSSSDTFLDEDEESEINMGDLLEDEDELYEIEVCVDTEDEVNEERESNNCRTEYLSIEDDANAEDDNDDEVTLSSDDEDDCDAYFYDTDGSWAENEVCDLYERSVVKGRTPHYYVLNDEVTRAEFLKIALLNADLDVEEVSSADDFTDVRSSDWFYEYVTFAADLGIIDNDDNHYYPNEAITRAEAVAILVRLELDGDDLDDLLDEDLDESDIDFYDVDDRDWFAPYIVYGTEEGLLEGYDNDAFRPYNNISRAEAAEIADRLYDTRY